MKRFASAVCLATILSSCNSAAEQAVRDTLVDPDSAEFREVSSCPGNPAITTGEVNGKNRMGAYTGYEFFFVEQGQVYFTASDGVMDVMDRCYGTDDADAAADAGADLNQSERAKEGSWTTNTEKDPIDDSAVITASLVAESGTAKFGAPVTIVARCGSNKTELYAIWNEYVGDDSRSVYNEYKNVEVRVGDAPARTEQWGISTDKQATFANSAVSLLKEMAGDEKLVLRMTPYGENPITAIFDLTGVKSAIGPIAKECNWEL